MLVYLRDGQGTNVEVTGMAGPGDCLFVGVLTSQQHASVSQGRICANVRAVTLRQKLQIKLFISPSHSILTPGKPVPALAL